MLGLVGKEGPELRCSEHPQGWNVVNTDLFLLSLIVGSFTKVTHGRAGVLVYSLGELSNKGGRSIRPFLAGHQASFFPKSTFYFSPFHFLRSSHTEFLGVPQRCQQCSALASSYFLLV